MPQAPVASMDTRIDGQHSRVTYYEEQDIQPVTDEEIIALCQLAQEQTIYMSNDELIDLIDRLGADTRGVVFL